MSPLVPPPDFFALIDPSDALDGAILLKRNGQTVGGWTRNAVPLEVVTVMAATMIGSLETLLETLGESTPETLALTTGKTRIFMQKVEPQGALLVFSSADVAESQLKEAARRLVSRLPQQTPPARPSGRVYNR